ncbi:cytochrome P450 [Mycobacterium pseudokansasii]|uniref:cytochrome P450 n=1 Tax=Mycobacterium pseudokansasii TaxID=2341080 RepID=UPI0007B52656|nr:cytochrome P450 [Mycobacterium pseudokansasii]KZS65636.1 cytochrome [Mycobacterium kansasii]VAZ97356.1 1,8-cineole 2-endo-monooxygenase [Mycobacterium pseudokansasii]VAZ98842.1 1,8-cineole 2-endo-monooxygenase [Mycobacterium pseudokansasii]
MVTRPGVSPDAIVDFDHHSDEFNLNELAVNAELRRTCPVAWNQNYGGFWFLTSYDAVSQAARDGDTFAHKYQPNAPDGIDYQGEMGVPRPEGHPALGIGEVDGPYHQALRHALAPFFSPGAVQKMRPFMEQSAHWFLDQRIADGRMDLVLDYASPVPAILTMRLMGLPYDNWHLYANLFHSVMAVPQDSPEYANALAAAPAMMHDVLEFAATRRADPHDDLTSFLIQFEFDGQRLSDEQLLTIIWNLIAGGVDTTTSQTALTLLHLGTHPQLRHQLIEKPDLYRTATDEFLRYFSVNQQLSRTVTRDVTVGGQQLRRNDRVVISWLAANHDEHEFDRPEAIVLDRTPNRHLAFGLGPHRCIGSHLARLMAEVMVRAVLDRIPDYRVDLDGVHQYRGNPSMTGLGKLPVVFTPTPRLGTQRPW